ncbi:leucine-rich repeat extensin-like protein 5 [Bufo gargarizans]|uniref:leucine-rich repeat extensin-like protein 5 n=1 Tax=Bufo gargarizans TaxID=30331 RepID=UPI001CF13DDB|nr:leucine-rich repeat extensin-like protein 5 [Bufo gargarizans]
MPKTPRPMDVGRLIVLVQDRPCIWDTRSDDYHDRYKKDQAWVEISKELFESIWEKTHGKSRQNLVDDVKNRWRSCRDQFRKEMLLHARSGSGASKKRPYMFKNQLMFLREVMELRPTEDNLPEEEAESAPQMSSACEEETPSGPSQVDTAPGQSTAPSRPPPVSGADSPPMPLSLPSRPRRRATTPADTNVNLQVLDYLSRARHEDEFDHYVRSMGSYLRRLPPERVLRTKAALNIVLDAATPPNDPHIVFEGLENWRLHGNLYGPQPMPVSQHSQPSLPAPPPMQPPRGHYGPPPRPYGPHYQVDSAYGQSAPITSQPGSSQYSGPPSQPPYPMPQYQAPPSPSTHYTNL